jgi:hypothetical protein
MWSRLASVINLFPSKTTMSCTTKSYLDHVLIDSITEVATTPQSSFPMWISEKLRLKLSLDPF